MDWKLTMNELRDYANRYWEMADRADGEGNTALAREFREIAQEAQALLVEKGRSAA